MRGPQEPQSNMLLAVTPEDLVPVDHPIRRIREIAGAALGELSATFTAMYAPNGRRPVPPERLLKGTLPMALYSMRSERQFCERLPYDLLFKWSLGLNISDRAFDHATFPKNRERPLKHAVAEQFLAAVTQEAQRRRLISDERFTVDGTLLQAWASLKSVRPRDEGDPPAPGGGRNPDVDFRGQQRTDDTHVSRTDPEARLARKGTGQETRLCYAGHVPTENRHGLILDAHVSQATGTAERDAALAMLDRRRTAGKRATLGADKGYDARAFVRALREREVTPHVAQNTSGRRSAIDGRTTRHAGYAVSQRVRKRVEECFGWIKTTGNGRQLRYIGLAKNQLWATFTAAAYNLVRMANIAASTA